MAFVKRWPLGFFSEVATFFFKKKLILAWCGSRLVTFYSDKWGFEYTQGGRYREVKIRGIVRTVRLDQIKWPL